MQGIVPYSMEEHSHDMITRRAFHRANSQKNTDLGFKAGLWVDISYVGEQLNICGTVRGSIVLVNRSISRDPEFWFKKSRAVIRHE